MLPFDVGCASRTCFDGDYLDADVFAAEVLDAAITVDNCFVKLYRQSAARADDSLVREFLGVSSGPNRTATFNSKR